jgi:hypothetical protein
MNSIKESLERTGAAMSQMPKGIPRTKYYTPDGREEFKIPQHRIRQDGVIYDVFLAQGYTLTPPENPKLYCSGCDRWHDTQEEVDACIQGKKKFLARMNKTAKQELTKERNEKDSEIAELKDRVDKLTKLLEDTLGKEI